MKTRIRNKKEYSEMTYRIFNERWGKKALRNMKDKDYFLSMLYIKPSNKIRWRRLRNNKDFITFTLSEMAK